MPNPSLSTPATRARSTARGMKPIHPFRPLFFGAAAFASIGMILWGLFLHLGWLPAAALPPPLWHGHAMLFGFAGALIGGFLLTASANWSGMATTTPTSLAALFTLWLAARIVFMTTLPAVAGDDDAGLAGTQRRDDTRQRLVDRGVPAAQRGGAAASGRRTGAVAGRRRSVDAGLPHLPRRSRTAAAARPRVQRSKCLSLSGLPSHSSASGGAGFIVAITGQRADSSALMAKKCV